ncbi:MAG: pyridoxal phosphate-dependent aminotransferase [Campylobacterales bacterium]|nr:pyridoxal phosphate-dependent aminotransferase [Campylobacterales bacterium]
MLTNRINSLSESMTIAITMLAKKLKSEGKDILSFSAGEPDFDTPECIKTAAIKAINDGFTKYTPVDGIPELLKAISNKLKRDNNLDYAPNEIIVSNGAKHSLYNVFQALIQEGDEVIIPAPYWVTYPELTKYCGGTVVEIQTTIDQRYKISPEQLKNAITPKTKLLILTSPSNPTGSVYSKEELEALAEVLKGTSVWVLSDEIYEKLVYDTKFISTGAISEDMLNRTITINGVSKSVSMTGWRMGYMACKNIDLVKACSALQSQSTSNICSITQKASIPALDGTADDDIFRMQQAFKARRDIACELLNEIEGITVVKPDGAFYLFVNIEGITKDDMRFSQELLKQKGVAVVPGCGFGSEGHFRFSFATDLESIKLGIERIAEFAREFK